MIATLESLHGRALRRRHDESGNVVDGEIDGPLLEVYIAKFMKGAVPPPRQVEMHLLGARAVVPVSIGDVHVRVNHGRWIIDCPVDGCTGASLAIDGDRRFICADCHSGPYRVVWPPANTRSKVEAALLVRPGHARNWFPGESVARLRAENEAHADEVGESAGDV